MPPTFISTVRYFFRVLRSSSLGFFDSASSCVILSVMPALRLPAGVPAGPEPAVAAVLLGPPT
eukprot:13888595-Heterocapsa_arctica.AAC.1